ncbi:hypothetical protein CEE37_06605 [candidate division LCP-89 bacterium B3_LCP]|uniref:Uncharacterized protein n=1 Tax=candidate division LCP-89 bacterium B3_LCP TaxID=2012998 RepID=A0A532V093_UNCL8|nr:MAG: hypothetical protein CEE37_06605 [candidate division LCP-89 bacterium B3_LCP]
MFDKPLDGILNREFRVAENADQLHILSDLFKKMVNYSTHALGRSMKSSRDKPRESTLILLFYRHIFEMLDAIEVLVAQSVFNPNSLLVRSSSEALLYMHYIVEKDTIRRARSFVYVKGLEKLRWKKMFKNGSEERKRIIKELKKDSSFVGKTGIPKFTDAPNRVKDDEEYLNSDYFKEIRSEYKKSKCKRWHALFSGYNDLEILARKLGRIGIYEFYYRRYSEAMHAENILKSINEGEDGMLSIKPLRLADEAEDLVIFGVYVWYEATKLLLEYFRPQEVSKYEQDAKQSIYPYLKDFKKR